MAKRLHDGVLDSQGRRVVPNIVRVGIEASVNASVKDLTLDYLVDVKLAGPGGTVSKPNAEVDTTALGAELATIRAQLEQKFAESIAAKTPAAEKQIQDEIAALKSKRFTISQRLESARDKQKSENRTLDAARRRFRSEVLLEADVVCSTLAGAGHETLEALEFETVVIDEAAQAIELSSLIPLKYGCRRCVMVGGMLMAPVSGAQKLTRARSETASSNSTLNNRHQVQLQQISLCPHPRRTSRFCPSFEVRH